MLVLSFMGNGIKYPCGWSAESSISISNDNSNSNNKKQFSYSDVAFENYLFAWFGVIPHKRIFLPQLQESLMKDIIWYVLILMENLSYHRDLVRWRTWFFKISVWWCIHISVGIATFLAVKMTILCTFSSGLCLLRFLLAA